MLYCVNRRSRPEVFCKEGVLRNFTKFTGKHLCQNLSFNKVAGLRSCEFCEISKNTFSYRTPPMAASVLRSWFNSLSYILTNLFRSDRVMVKKSVLENFLLDVVYIRSCLKLFSANHLRWICIPQLVVYQ